MDRKEKPPRRRDFANQGIEEADALAVGSPTGREAGAHSAGSDASDDVRQPVGGPRRSDVTGRHDDGMGANETIDGLTDSEEELRRQAEDVPLAAEPDDEDEADEQRREGAEDAPVFDQASRPPRT